MRYDIEKNTGVGLLTFDDREHALLKRALFIYNAKLLASSERMEIGDAEILVAYVRDTGGNSRTLRLAKGSANLLAQVLESAVPDAEPTAMASLKTLAKQVTAADNAINAEGQINSEVADFCQTIPDTLPEGWSET